MITVAPLKLEDLDALGAGEHRDKVLPWDMAYTMFRDGVVVAVGGLHKTAKGEGYAWTIMSEQAKASPLIMRRIHNAAKLLFPIAREQMELTTVDCWADANDTKACGWPASFGFIEKTMPKHFQWCTNG